MTEDLDQLIEDYLNKNLSETDRQNLEQKLSEDQELAAMVKDLQSIEQGLHAVGMDQLSKDMRGWEQELKLDHSYSGGWKKYLAVAAVITLILVPAVFLFTDKNPTSEELFIAYYEPYEEMLTSRGNSVDSLGMLLADGMDAYNRGAYKLCSELLESYLAQQPEAHRVALYLGIAQLEINQQQSAESNFKRAQLDPSFKQQAQWYQALSYLKFKDRDKARDVLTAIAGSENHYRKSEAERLLNDLK